MTRDPEQPCFPAATSHPIGRRQLHVRLVAALALGLASASAHADRLTLDGAFTQGGLIEGKTDPGTRITLDGTPLRVAADGAFLIGFDHDAKPKATLVARFPDGTRETRALAIESRAYRVQRIDGLPPAQVTPSPAVLARIKKESAALRSALDRYTDASWYLAGFSWPVIGPMSGVYGSRRILNGEPRAPHLGVDIAAPEGTPIRAPAAGTVVFARPNLFFTGATVVLDHGRGLTTLYAHLSETDVRVGEHVEKGAVIGRVGKSGRATGPNLHWGAYLLETRLDPALLAGPMPASGDGSTATAPAAPGSNPR